MEGLTISSGSDASGTTTTFGDSSSLAAVAPTAFMDESGSVVMLLLLLLLLSFTTPRTSGFCHCHCHCHCHYSFKSGLTVIMDYWKASIPVVVSVCVPGEDPERRYHIHIGM